MPFGILSDICLAAGFFPQFWQIWKDREVIGLSYIFLAMDTIGAVFSILSLGELFFRLWIPSHAGRLLTSRVRSP